LFLCQDAALFDRPLSTRNPLENAKPALQHLKGLDIDQVRRWSPARRDQDRRSLPLYIGQNLCRLAHIVITQIDSISRCYWN